MAAGAQRFYISETNPNDSIGGGGCLCSEGRCEDRGGPYAVFNATEMDTMLSPHVVVCAPCVTGVARAMAGAERTPAGEPTPEPDTSTPVDSYVPAPESPSAEGGYPVLDDDDDLVAI